jgi:hypothetical protein
MNPAVISLGRASLAAANGGVRRDNESPVTLPERGLMTQSASLGPATPVPERGMRGGVTRF